MKGLKFGCLGLRGLDPIGLEFESLVSDPRPGLRGLEPEMFMGIDFPRL